VGLHVLHYCTAGATFADRASPTCLIRVGRRRTCACGPGIGRGRWQCRLPACRKGMPRIIDPVGRLLTVPDDERLRRPRGVRRASRHPDGEGGRLRTGGLCRPGEVVTVKIAPLDPSPRPAAVWQPEPAARLPRNHHTPRCGWTGLDDAAACGTVAGWDCQDPTERDLNRGKPSPAADSPSFCRPYTFVATAGRSRRPSRGGSSSHVSRSYASIPPRIFKPLFATRRTGIIRDSGAQCNASREAADPAALREDVRRQEGLGRGLVARRSWRPRAGKM
jgi:hypothetical protein